MSIKLQDITTSTNLDLTDKVLISDGTSEHLVTVETFLGRMSTLYQGIKGSGAQTIADAKMYKIALASTGVEVPAGDSGMEISNGGIKVTSVGSYKVTASIYLTPSSSSYPNGVYVFYGTSFTDGAAADTGATELCGVYDNHSQSTTIQVTGILTNVPANTIFFLVGRASNSATASVGNGWLLVERLA